MIKLEDETQIAGNGSTDDSAALRSISLNAPPGEVIVGKRGAHYWLSGNYALPERGIPLNGIHLDPNGATFSFAFDQDSTYGFRLLNKAKVWGEGTVKTAVSQNSGTQSMTHAPICIGALYGDDGPINVANPYLDPRGWKVGGGLSLETVKPDGALIQICGTPEDWLIEDVFFPDSAYMGTGIGADWTPRGNGVSNDLEQHNNLQKFIANQFWTIHPSFGTIRRVYAGKMTNTNYIRSDGGPTIIRLSGTDNIEVDTVHAKLASCLYCYVAGDLGREFAKDADKLRANKGNTARRMTLDCHSGLNAGVVTNSVADNVERAMSKIQNNSGGATYSPMLPPLGTTDLIIKDATVVRTADSLTVPQRAFWTVSVDGVKFENCNSIGCSVGIHVDSSSDNVKIIGGVHEDAVAQSIFVHGTIAPRDTWVAGVRAIRSGQGGGNVGAIELGNCINPVATGNTIGVRGDPKEKASWGVRASDSAIGYVITDNRILKLRSTGSTQAISCGSYESLGIGRSANNYVAAGLDPYGGSAIVLIQETYCVSGRTGRLFAAVLGSALNASGPVYNASYFKNGDCIILVNATSSSAKMMQKVNGSWVTS